MMSNTGQRVYPHWTEVTLAYQRISPDSKDHIKLCVLVKVCVGGILRQLSHKSWMKKKTREISYQMSTMISRTVSRIITHNHSHKYLPWADFARPPTRQANHRSAICIRTRRGGATLVQSAAPRPRLPNAVGAARCQLCRQNNYCDWYLNQFILIMLLINRVSTDPSPASYHFRQSKLNLVSEIYFHPEKQTSHKNIFPI